MNLGVERFLLLGCVAVILLELPEVLSDLAYAGTRGAVLAAPAAVVRVEVPPSAEVLFAAAPVAPLPPVEEALLVAPLLLPAEPGL